MDELERLIVKARKGDPEAYGEIVRRFQDMAVGYAYSYVRDFHLAEDVAQEAFIEVYGCLGKLRRPAAFPSWFRKIVFKHCDRTTRGKRMATVSLEAAGEIGGGDSGMAGEDEALEMADRVSRALEVLPERDHQVLTLFYISEYSQAEIGAFLDVQEKTVKSRLHSARKVLRERMTKMVEKDLQARRPSRDGEFVAEVMEDLLELTDLEIDALLRQTEQKDLIVALQGVSEELKKRILANVPSVRVRGMYEKWIAELDSVPAEEAEQVRQRILGKVPHLKPKPKPRLSKEYLEAKNDLKKRLEGVSAAGCAADELAAILAGLVEVREAEGIMAFHELVDGASPGDQLQAELIPVENGHEPVVAIREPAEDASPGDLLRLGIMMVGDGCAPDLLADFLEERIRALLWEQETRYRMIARGLVAIQDGKSAEGVEERVAAVREGGRLEG